MIESGDIFAEIDDAKGMVHFQEDPLTSDDPDLMASLDNQITQSIKLAEKVQSLDHEVKHCWNMLSGLLRLVQKFENYVNSVM